MPGQPPASIPQLRRAKPIPELSGPHWGRLPSQPGPLLAAIYRQLRAQPKDSVPGKPPGAVTVADLNEEVFGEFMLMLNNGLDPSSYAVIGGKVFTDLPSTGPVTVTSSQVWQAYYDRNGNKL